jgi:glucosylglycerate phosphorylase
MSDAIARELTFLYGPSLGGIEGGLRALMRDHRGPSRGAERLDEGEAVLISYADSLRAPGEAPLQTLRRFLRVHAPGVVRTVHLLPFYPWTSDDGFSVVDDRAVDPAVGTWEDVVALRQDVGLMFDVVLNHASVASRAFQGYLAGEAAYRDWFIDVDPETDLSAVVRPRTSPLLTPFEGAEGPLHVWSTFSADQVDRNYANPRVLLDLVDIVLGYLARGATILRLDAVTYLWKEIGTPCVHHPKTHAVMRLLRTVVDACYPQAVLLTETNVPHHENISYFGSGHDEVSMVYNFALPPLLLHTFGTGDARELSRWASELRTPSHETTFLNFLASHDGIGVRPVEALLREEQVAAMVARVQAHGGLVSYRSAGRAQLPYELNISLFDALSDPAANEPAARSVDRFVAAHAIMFALAGVPALYLHSLLGSRSDHANVAALGYPRAINRSKLDAAALAAELAQPDGRRAQVLARLSSLLRVRRRERAFHPQASQRVLDLGPGAFALVREDPEGAVVCVHDIGGEGLSVDHQALAALVGWSGSAHDLLGGPALTPGGRVRLPGYGLAWWRGAVA